MTISKAALRCPHCKGPMHIRTSRLLSAYYRQAHVACLDPECGATYGVAHEITHQISPSAKPDPTVMIRSSPPRVQKPEIGTDVLAANDAANLTLSGFAGDSGRGVPPPANDEGTPHAVIGL